MCWMEMLCTVLLFHESLKPGDISLPGRNFGIARLVEQGRDFLGHGECFPLENRSEKRLSGGVCVAEAAWGREMHWVTFEVPWQPNFGLILTQFVLHCSRPGCSTGLFVQSQLSITQGFCSKSLHCRAGSVPVEQPGGGWTPGMSSGITGWCWPLPEAGGCPWFRFGVDSAKLS